MFKYVIVFKQVKNEKIKLSVTGCLGRMGKQVIKSAKNSKNLQRNGLYKSFSKTAFKLFYYFF